MNYFELYPGDYLRDTSRLTLLQHGVYLRLLMAYYSEEIPLPGDEAELHVIVAAVTAADKAAVKRVADRFFPIGSDGLRRNLRADEEIAKARKRIDAARSNGKKGGSPLKKAGYNEPGFLYAIQRAAGGPVKVGITKNVQARMSEISRKTGEIVQLQVFEVSDMGAAEAGVHKHFAHCLDGEWVNAEPEEVLRVAAHWAGQYGIAGQPNGQSKSAKQGAHSGEALHAPHANQEIPPTAGASAPPSDPIFGEGLDFLKRKGIREGSARSFLGLLRKELHDDLTVAELLVEAERQDVSNPQAWLTRAAKQRKSEGASNGHSTQGRRLSAVERVAQRNAEAESRAESRGSGTVVEGDFRLTGSV